MPPSVRTAAISPVWMNLRPDLGKKTFSTCAADLPCAAARSPTNFSAPSDQARPVVTLLTVTPMPAGCSSQHSDARVLKYGHSGKDVLTQVA